MSFCPLNLEDFLYKLEEERKTDRYWKAHQ